MTSVRLLSESNKLYEMRRGGRVESHALPSYSERLKMLQAVLGGKRWRYQRIKQKIKEHAPLGPDELEELSTLKKHITQLKESISSLNADERLKIASRGQPSALPVPFSTHGQRAAHDVPARKPATAAIGYLCDSDWDFGRKSR
jgi:hypothetical protein